MTADVDTLESQVSEQLALLAGSLGELKAQAEAHGSSSRTLAETAKGLGDLITALKSTADAVQESSEAVRKVDTAAVLGELQETRSNLETALTTARQQNDTFQSKQESSSSLVAENVTHLREATEETGRSVKVANESIKRLEDASSTAKTALKKDLDALSESMTAGLSAATQKLATTSEKLHSGTTATLTQALNGQSLAVTEQLSTQAEQLHAQSGETLTQAIHAQARAVAEHVTSKSVELHAETGQALAAARTEQTAALTATSERLIEPVAKRVDELAVNVAKNRTLILMFGSLSVIGTLAILGYMLFGR